MEALSEIKNAALYGVANNGKEALDKLESSVVFPDLIFLDLDMPVMNGIEFLTEIIHKPRMRHIPVVILTTAPRQIELIRKLGAKAFIKKHSENEMLRRQLKQMINLDFITDSRIANQTFQSAFSV